MAEEPAPGGWHHAKLRLKQLESATEKMSSSWFIGNAGVITAAGLFLLSAVILAGTLTHMLGHYNETQRTQNVLREEVALQEALDEASAAARAYAIGQDKTLIATRDLSKRVALDHLHQLRGLLADDPTAMGILGIIEQQIQARMSLFDHLVIRPAEAAGEEAERLRLVHSNNAEITALRDLVRGKLQFHQRHIMQDLQFAVGLVFFAGFAAPLCGLIGIHLLQKERDSRRARELQTELMHVQRLAIMGETSAMLAHEINQPLTAATNYLSVLKRHLDAGAVDKAMAMADRTTQQIQRAGGILRKLRRFIEKREDERSLEAPEVLIEDAITLLGTLDSSVALNTRLSTNLPRVLVDRVQLQQVLVNLLRNAIEAMQDSPRRDLVLSVALQDSDMIEVSLADSGPGLTKEVAERLFQPFVSTKQSGMGVGLSICRSIVAQHGGRIWAEPNPAGGAVFRFTLPAAKERVAA